MITDFHSHILPGIDDGSKNPAMTAKMMELEKKSGVDTIVATPHFYLSEQSLDRFLERRENAYELIKSEAERQGITVRLGAEVYFTPSLADLDLKKLCVNGTNCIMLELPYSKLTGSFIRTFKSFVGSISSELTVVLAHAERYLNFTDEESLYEILDTGLLVQLNCGSFKMFSPHLKFMYNLISCGNAHLLGTDCHNITSRSPNMETGKKAIERKFSHKEYKRFMKNAEAILCGKAIGE